MKTPRTAKIFDMNLTGLVFCFKWDVFHFKKSYRLNFVCVCFGQLSCLIVELFFLLYAIYVVAALSVFILLLLLTIILVLTSYIYFFVA